MCADDPESMEQPNPDRIPMPVVPREAPSPWFTNWPLVWFCISYYSLAAFWGVHSAVAAEESPAEFILQIGLVLCLSLWAVADSRRRQKPIPRSLQFWFFLLAGILVPAYFIVTRGWKGAGWIVLHILGWFAVATLAMHITGFFYFGDRWWQVFE